MDGILEHEVNEIGGRLHELVQLLKILELSSLLLVKDIKGVLGSVELHILELSC